MKKIGNFISVDHVKRNNAQQGYHWFDAATMQSFKTKLGSDLFGGCVFVSSEKNDMPYMPPQPRKYSIRVAMDNGSIQTYAFHQYDTMREAKKEAKWLGKALKNGTMRWCNDTYEFVSNGLLD
jgi:hypothetical protein